MHGTIQLPADASKPRSCVAAKDVYKRQTLDTAGVAGRTQRRSKYGAKRPKAGQAAAPAKGKGKKYIVTAFLKQRILI